MSLREYSENFPKLRKSFKEILEILEGIQAVQESDLADLKVLSGLYNKANSLFQYTLIGLTQPSKQEAISSFVHDHQGPKVLYKITEKLYRSCLTTPQASTAIIAKNSNATDAAIACLCTILGCLQNFVDAHDAFSLACGETGLVSLFNDMCEKIVADGTDPNTGEVALSDKSREIVKRGTNVLYNLSRGPGNRTHFGNCNATATLLHFTTLPSSSVGFEIPVLALLSLAYLIDEKNNHLIMADDSLVEFLIDLLNKAVTSADRRYEGFTPVELADGLTHIAVNDANKAAMGSKGAVRVLLMMIKHSKDEKEQVSATNALWTLAFDDANKEIIKHAGGIGVLKTLQERTSQELRKAADGALWEISGRKERDTRGTANDNLAQEHVMISYQWDAQPTVVELKNRLQTAGYKVWLDIEEMGGSTLDAMAKAVERASAVLVCVSRKYNASPNCRSEAEYAYQKRKLVIPLMMEDNYKPDGWLGIIIGTKLRFNFWCKDDAPTSTEKLKKELATSVKKDGQMMNVKPINADQVDSAPLAAPLAATTPTKSNVSEWTTEEVESWLSKIGLHDVCRKVVQNLSGETLISFRELRKECPEYFYRSLEKDLNLQNVFNVFKFCDELTKLLG